MRWGLAALAVAVLAVALYITFANVAGGQCPRDVKIYAAPTLVRFTRDALVRVGVSTDGLLSVGSVEALRRIQQGATPDVFVSVDIELAEKMGKPLDFLPLGRFKISVVCRERLNSPQELATVKTALSDPNKAPIGYREVALAWLLYRDGKADLLDKYRRLGIRFTQGEIYIPTALPDTDLVTVQPNLDGSWSVFEIGGVDCVFVHTPFLFGRVKLLEEVNSTELWTAYRGRYRDRDVYVYFFKSPYDFFNDPPHDVYVNLVDPAGRIVNRFKVIHFEAFAAAFTESGRCVLNVMREMDKMHYGLYD